MGQQVEAASGSTGGRLLVGQQVEAASGSTGGGC